MTFHHPLRLARLALLATLIFILLQSCIGGCSEGYTIPAAGANLRAFGLESGTSLSDSTQPDDFRRAAQPASRFPALIAAARVQSSEFHSRRERYHNRGGYSLITTRDVEDQANLEKLASESMIRGIVPISALMLDAPGQPQQELREAALTLGADMLLLYTFDSTTQTDHHVPELSVLTLGLAPEGESIAVCTASAILIDARTGYTYCIAEATDRQKRLASAWSGSSAENKAHRKAQENAFEELIDNLQQRWAEVVMNYAPGQPSKTASIGS